MHVGIEAGQNGDESLRVRLRERADGACTNVGRGVAELIEQGGRRRIAAEQPERSDRLEAQVRVRLRRFDDFGERWYGGPVAEAPECADRLDRNVLVLPGDERNQ